MKQISFDEALEIAAEQHASDAHFEGRTLWVRTAGVLHPVPDVELSAECVSAVLVKGWLDEAKFSQHEADFYGALNGRDLRCHLWTAAGEKRLAVRLLRKQPPLLTELDAPAGLIKLADTPGLTGLLLITGATGAGKSTTLAAFVRHLNEKKGYGRHIVMLEDPIEYRMRSVNCLINQREIGHDTADFRRAMRYVLRQDPDIIVVGEMRDHESVDFAVLAAETGHLVIGTMHSSTAPRAITRILDETPEHDRDAMQAKLSVSLVGVCSQCLPTKRSPTKGDERIGAFEFMGMTPAVRNMVHDGKVGLLGGEILKGDRQNNGSLELYSSLARLVKSGTITLAEAMEHAADPTVLEQRMAGK